VRRNTETALKLGVVILTLVIIIVANIWRYNCCLDSGFSPQQCQFFMCSSGR
jgi:hypothetical protein